MRDPRAVRPGGGGGLPVLVLLTVLAVLAAPQAHALRGRLAAAGLPTLHLPHLPAGTALPAAGEGSVRAGRVVAFALAQRGKPYQWGTQGPSAFDCSGLAWAAYHAAGLDWPRMSADGQWRRGPRVLGAPRPGDLVFFHTAHVPPGEAGHVGVYLGGGRMVEAPGSGARVRVASVGRAGYLGATRPTPRGGGG